MDLLTIVSWAVSLVLTYALGALSTIRYAKKLNKRYIDAEIAELRRLQDETFASLRKQAGLS